jgi:glycine betaine/proline transport system substrate-binding protein
MRSLLCGLMAVGLFASSAAVALADDSACKVVRLSDPGWTDITATSGLASVVLTALGYQPDIKALSVPIGYEAMKSGDTDVFLGNWMPAQQHFIDDLKSADAIEVLNQNLAGAKFTLAVPAYMADRGVKDFADLAAHAAEFESTIYGIEAGAPANDSIQKMIDLGDFGLEGWQLVDSSEQGMLAQVERAVNADQGIVFLAWAPHPMNEQFQLEYLSGGDAYFGPNYGGAEVYTLARKGWSGDCPNAAKLFSNMTFDISMENQLMGKILAGAEGTAAATEWLKGNPEVLTQWLDGVTTLDGQPGDAAVKAALGL